MTVTISVRGQMVMPAEIRRRYGITPRSKVELIDLGNEIIIVPIPKKSFSASRGMLKGVSSKYAIQLRKKERDAEHNRR